ncbi:BrnT family toxin [Terracidiphilus sp.]|jgi:uncharacterized DUF497 family protein|uniref:BrnT family toxin n=1 Tax=Terracidiphilus sp. TaxID=1964191 RepID=UPI003C1388B2
MIEDVEFEWDLDKAAKNERKHGVTFAFATNVFFDPSRTARLDPDDHEREERWITTGRVGQFVLVVVYTLRGEMIRIISARKAERNEYLSYWHGQISF